MEGLDLSAVPVPEGTTLPEELGGSDLLPDNHAGSDVVVPTAEALGALTGSLRAIDDGLASSTILKLKGLPYSCTEQDIKNFFAGFDVNKVAWVSEPDGRPSGLAFAEFGTKEEALKALAKNGEYIGERYVRLLHVPRQEMEEQVRMGTLAIPGGAAKLRARMLRGQPRANNNGLAFLPPGALQLVPASALPAGAGGARPAQMQQMQQMRAVQNAGQQYLIAGPAQGSSTGQYTIQAIPQSSTGTFTVQQGGTTYTVQGLPAGTTYQLQAPASFSMANNSAYAMPGNMQMGMQVATASPMEARSWQSNSGYGQGQQGQAGGATYQANSAMALAAQFQGMNLAGGGGGMLATAAPGGGAQVVQGGMGGGQMMQQQTVLVPMQSMQQMQGMQQHMQGMQSMQGMQQQMQGMQSMQPAQLANSRLAQQQAAAAAAQAMQASSGPTVKIRGLPFRSSPADILAFFQGYSYLPDSLQIGLDQLGRPSGEAWLTFASPAEALRAVRDLNRHYLGSRYLELTLC